ncbi:MULTISPECIES: hypothetical protein [Actinoalloteichus]|nr:hypothetical protein [Actinoalloteichus spitiensis]
MSSTSRTSAGTHHNHVQRRRHDRRWQLGGSNRVMLPQGQMTLLLNTGTM